MNLPPGRHVQTDWIHLRDLQVEAVLGVYPEERVRTRPISLNISLACRAHPASASDDLSDALNYEDIEAAAIRIAQEGRFKLIETLAERMATHCLSHPLVTAVRVVVDKPGALAHARSVAVDIFRQK
ncbi:MAG: dihydroneopterin aldolase [Verrucomicrobiota bacterium]|nr:dihydroneopterin aldolase [Verrucomicrobiota bacterium]